MFYSTEDLLILIFIFGILFAAICFSIYWKLIIHSIVFITIALFELYIIALSYNDILKLINNNESRIEQTTTIISYKILKNGMKIPIDTIELNIKIPDIQYNY